MNPALIPTKHPQTQETAKVKVTLMQRTNLTAFYNVKRHNFIEKQDAASDAKLASEEKTVLGGGEYCFVIFSFCPRH